MEVVSKLCNLRAIRISFLESFKDLRFLTRLERIDIRMLGFFPQTFDLSPFANLTEFELGIWKNGVLERLLTALPVSLIKLNLIPLEQYVFSDFSELCFQMLGELSNLERLGFEMLSCLPDTVCCLSHLFLRDFVLSVRQFLLVICEFFGKDPSYFGAKE